jgi:hypothetical protein
MHTNRLLGTSMWSRGAAGADAVASEGALRRGWKHARSAIIMLRHALVSLLAGVTAAASDGGVAAKPCTAYAFWTDHGCRTWSTPCTKRGPTSHIETLSVRKPGTSSFTVAGKGEICSGAPDFRDGPGATPTDAACRQRCLNGEHGIHTGPHHGPSPPPLPQGPVDLTIHTDSVTHEISPLAMGCHSDSGCEWPSLLLRLSVLRPSVHPSVLRPSSVVLLLLRLLSVPERCAVRWWQTHTRHAASTRR